MNDTFLNQITLLRFLVGYLGEKSQHGWWQSDFLSSTSEPFLSPVFSKTMKMAQYFGVTEAAAIIHDERIGKGSGVYHLFRLPAYIEQDIHNDLIEQGDELPFSDYLSSANIALNELSRHSSGNVDSQTAGPVFLGDTEDLHDAAKWQKVSAHYLNGFRREQKVFPYFMSKSNGDGDVHD